MNFNVGSKVVVVGGKFVNKYGKRDDRAAITGEVDKCLPSGAVVATFKQGHGDEARAESYIFAASSLKADS